VTWLDHTHKEDMTNAERLIFQTFLVVASVLSQWWFPFIGPLLMWTSFIVSDYAIYKLGMKDDKINETDPIEQGDDL